MKEKDVWFVRSNGGSGSYPVTRQGWIVVANFLLEVAFFSGVAIALAVLGIGEPWLWVAVFVVGMAVSAGIFILIARQRTDFSMTYEDYLREKQLKS